MQRIGTFLPSLGRASVEELPEGAIGCSLAAAAAAATAAGTSFLRCRSVFGVGASDLAAQTLPGFGLSLSVVVLVLAVVRLA